MQLSPPSPPPPPKALVVKISTNIVGRGGGPTTTTTTSSSSRSYIIIQVEEERKMQYPVAHSTTLRVASFTLPFLLAQRHEAEAEVKPRFQASWLQFRDSPQGFCISSASRQQKQKRQRPTSKTNYGKDKQLHGRENASLAPCLVDSILSRGGRSLQS